MLFAIMKGYGIRMGEVQRFEEQQRLHIKNGVSWTMDSMHLKKCASDLYFTKDGRLVPTPQLIGDYWESLDPLNEWGGNWVKRKDKPHFQRTV
jgi:peptidoglycan L-alanyl-D-glutamate endopeptidase CwlK